MFSLLEKEKAVVDPTFTVMLFGLNNFPPQWSIVIENALSLVVCFSLWFCCVHYLMMTRTTTSTISETIGPSKNLAGALR